MQIRFMLLVAFLIACVTFADSQAMESDSWYLVLHQPHRPDQVVSGFTGKIFMKQIIDRQINGISIRLTLDPQPSFLVFRAEAIAGQAEASIYFSIVKRYNEGTAYNFNGIVAKPEIYRQSPHDINAWIVNDIAMQPIPVIALKQKHGFEVAVCGSPVLYDNYTSQAFYPDKKYMELSSGDNGASPGLHPDSASVANISYNKEKTQIFTPGRIVAHYHLISQKKSHIFEGIIFHADQQDLNGLRKDVNLRTAEFFSGGKYKDYFGSLAFTTAYMNLRVNETGKSAIWVVPSVEYANTQYCRDAFWISMMLSDSMSAECLKNELDSVNSYAEYPLFAVLWAYRAQRQKIPVDLVKVQKYLNSIEKRSPDGYYHSFDEHDGRKDFQYWGDIIAFDTDDVITYNQGLFTVALFAAREMGLQMTIDPEKSLKLYREMYNVDSGYYPISKKKKKLMGPDPLLPDLLSIIYLGHPILPDQQVQCHYDRMTNNLKTNYGFKVIANQDGTFLKNQQYDVEGYISQANLGKFTDGQYFRGGSFFLYDELFLIDACLHGIKKAEDNLVWRTTLDFSIGSTTYECLNTVTGEAWKPNMGWNVAVYAIWRKLWEEGKVSDRLFREIDKTCKKNKS